MLNDNRQRWAVLSKLHKASIGLLWWLKRQNTEDVVDVLLIVVLTVITVMYGWVLS